MTKKSFNELPYFGLHSIGRVDELGSLVPTSFLARTRNTYFSPGERPVTVKTMMKIDLNKKK